MSEEDKVFKRVEYSFKGPLTLKTHKLSELTEHFGPDDILVKVKAGTLNPVDLTLFNSASLLFYKRHDKGIGRDFSGVVEKVGANVKDAKVGDRIAGTFEEMYTHQGSLSQYLVFNREKSRHSYGVLPPACKLSFVEASSFPLVFATAYTTLTHHHKPTETTRALVYGGATAVGGYVIQLLKKHHNVEFVASVNSGKSKERVKGYGADAIIDYKTQDVAKEAVKIAQESGKKFDLIIDTVGNNVLFPVIDKVLKPKSTDSGYVTIVGDHIANYNASFLSYFSFGLMRKLLLPTSFNYNLSTIEGGGKWFDLALRLFEEGKIKPTIDSVYKLEDFQQAITRLADHQATGKVVIEMD